MEGRDRSKLFARVIRSLGEDCVMVSSGPVIVSQLNTLDGELRIRFLEARKGCSAQFAVLCRILKST